MFSLPSLLAKLFSSGVAPSREYDIRLFGAKCDAVYTNTGTVNGTTFSDSTASFTNADVNKPFWIAGAGPGGTVLSTTIQAYVSPTSVTLANAASVAWTGNAVYLYGTDDSAAWLAAYNACGNKAFNTIRVPYGISLTAPIPLKTNICIWGQQPDSWAFVNNNRTSGVVFKPGSTGPGMFYAVNTSVGNNQIQDVGIIIPWPLLGRAVYKSAAATTVAGGYTVSDSTASFTSADLGKKFWVLGANPGGASSLNLGWVDTIGVINSGTQFTSISTPGYYLGPHPASFAVTNQTYCYGYDSILSGIDGTTLAAGNTLSSTSAVGKLSNSMVGMLVEIVGALGPAWGTGALNNGDGKGSTYFGTVTAVNSATGVVTLSQNTDLALTNCTWRIGGVTGLYYPASPTSQDTLHRFTRVVIKNATAASAIIGNFNRANRFFDVQFFQSMGHGLYLGSSDNILTNCLFAQSGEDNLYITQSTNHIIGGDTFSGNGNGVYMNTNAVECSILSLSVDANSKNGMICFAKDVSIGGGTRFNSNSQCGNGLYDDLTVCTRYATGVTNLNLPGVSIAGCSWQTGSADSNGFKPLYGVHQVGPYPLYGSVLYDPGTSPWYLAGNGNAITSGTVTTISQTSFAIVSGTTVNFLGNNTFNTSVPGGLTIGSSKNDYLGLWGNRPIQQPVLAGTETTSVVNSLQYIAAQVGLARPSDWATFTGSLSGNTLTVTTVASGTIAIGQSLFGPGVTNCVITGGSGLSWTFSGSAQTVASTPYLSSGTLPNSTNTVTTATLTSTSYTVNATNNAVYNFTLTAVGCPITLSAPAGATIRLYLTQGTGGSFTMSWPTIRWQGGSAPTLTTAAGKTDIITLSTPDGTNWFGSASLNY